MTRRFKAYNIIDQGPLRPIHPDNTWGTPGNLVEWTCYKDLLIGWKGMSIKNIFNRNRQVLPKKMRKWHTHIERKAPMMEATFRLLGMDDHADCMAEVIHAVGQKVLLEQKDQAEKQKLSDTLNQHPKSYGR